MAGILCLAPMMQLSVYGMWRVYSAKTVFHQVLELAVDGVCSIPFTSNPLPPHYFGKLRMAGYLVSLQSYSFGFHITTGLVYGHHTTHLLLGDNRPVYHMTSLSMAQSGQSVTFQQMGLHKSYVFLYLPPNLAISFLLLNVCSLSH
ncbi:hypothetical protein FB451DRAFT_735307 [Mycena latifolia]|nr:hypothetical protein FB451DRAFT_735307 [Mycena latifolia]